MRTALLLRLVTLLAAALVAGGCPRSGDVPVERQHRDAHAQYAWQMPYWKDKLGAAQPAAPTADVGTGGAVELPSDQGHHPKFGETDTLDTAKLPGEWLLVSHIENEQIILRAPTSMSIFQFSANGTFNLRLVYEGEVKQTTPGTWEKSGPGVLSVSNEGNAPQTYYGEMDGRDFMFLWNFEHKNGLWFVRRPDKSTPLIQGNDFVFTNGDHLRLREVRGQSFLGTLTTGTEEMEVSGGYNQGVLNLHWIDKPNNVDGYAAFVVTPDWKDLYGIWWLNDFMSSPVGGRWATPGGEALAAASAAAGSAPPQPMPPPAAPPGGSPA